MRILSRPKPSRDSDWYSGLPTSIGARRAPDPDAKYPRLSSQWNEHNGQANTLYVRNGKMLRLKTAEIGYSYKMMRVYVSGTNLLTFSPFKYWDPEKGSGNGLSYPLQRTFNLGFQFNF